MEELLVERELFLATARGELLFFERRYVEKVGHLYVELDRLKAERAERAARRKPEDRDARERAEDLGRQARHSKEEYEDRLRRAPRPGARPEPTADVKDLYRRLAKQFHPDLTDDPSEKAFRHEMMARINAAYSIGDVEELMRIEQEEGAERRSSKATGRGSEMERILRRWQQVTDRLRAVEVELAELQQSTLWKLCQQWKTWSAEGRDLLESLADQVRAEIDAERAMP